MTPRAHTIGDELRWWLGAAVDDAEQALHRIEKDSTPVERNNRSVGRCHTKLVVACTLLREALAELGPG